MLALGYNIITRCASHYVFHRKTKTYELPAPSTSLRSDVLIAGVLLAGRKRQYRNISIEIDRHGYKNNHSNGRSQCHRYSLGAYC